MLPEDSLDSGKIREELGPGARAFVWLNGLVALGAIGIVAFWLDLGIYRWLLGADIIGLAIIFGGLALAIVYVVLLGKAPADRWSYRSSWIPSGQLGRSVATVWSWAVIVFLAGVLIRSYADAGQYNLHNCWSIRAEEKDSTTVSILECVPGSEPVQGSSYSPWSESGGYQFCDRLRTTSSGGTIWRCEAGDV